MTYRSGERERCQRARPGPASIFPRNAAGNTPRDTATLPSGQVRRSACTPAPVHIIYGYKVLLVGRETMGDNLTGVDRRVMSWAAAFANAASYAQMWAVYQMDNPCATLLNPDASQGDLYAGVLGRAQAHCRELVGMVNRLERELAAANRTDLRGRKVTRVGDDSPAPVVGTVLGRAGSLGDIYVWVRWDDEGQPAVREAIDDLMLR